MLSDRVPSASLLALRATGVGTLELARLVGCGKMTASRWLRCQAIPEPEWRERIEATFAAVGVSVPAGTWLTVRSPLLAQIQENARQPSAPPVGVLEGARALRAEGRIVPREIQQTIAIELRDLSARAQVAAKALTPAELLEAHPAWCALRARLLDAVALWPAVRLEMPATESATLAELEQARAALVALSAEVQGLSAAAMGAGDIGLAGRYDQQRARADAYARKALRAGDADELAAGVTFQGHVAAVCDALRGHPDATRAALLVCDASDPFARALRDALAGVRSITFPCLTYQDDPVGFAHTVLGAEPWAKQVELLENARDHERVACASGHRVGKTDAIAMLVCWFYSCFPEARVLVTAPSEKQLQDVVWRAVRKYVARSGVCLACRKANAKTVAPCPHSAKIDGVIADKIKTGMTSVDFREVRGFTARDAEGIAGFAGINLLIIGEEASGIPQSIFGALSGNLAGGGRFVLIGNPTRNDGEFYEIFHRPAKLAQWKTMSISSWDSPNVKAGRKVIEGLATAEWCEGRKAEWGEDSLLYKVRVLGQFPIGEDGKLISLAMLTASEQAWRESDDPEGDLQIGIDPAGPSGLNDASGFAVRRGQKILEVYERRALDDDGHLAELLGLLARYRKPRELVVVVVDADGVGSGTLARLRQYESTSPGVISVHSVRGSGNATLEPEVYDRIRDELGAQFAKWMRGGGEIPESAQLEKQLHAYEMRAKLCGPKGIRTKLIDKKTLISILGRSPDLGDACLLCTWPPLSLRAQEAEGERQIEDARRDREDLVDVFDARDAIDPLGGEW